jgi:hypothetical protein|tara:strand:- start:435 stop:899 length:465 start_codon:yes stop_codon:yes gene_type:complete
MFSKKENKEIRVLFFTSFGRYMSNELSSNGEKIKWFNYPTKIKDIHFKLHCDKNYASIFVDIQHKDEDIRELFFDQFKDLKKPFIQYLGTSWSWEKEYKNEIGFSYSRIIRKINNVSIYDKNSWSKIFRFYKSNLLKLDKFWINFNEIFKQLES